MEYVVKEKNEAIPKHIAKLYGADHLRDSGLKIDCFEVCFEIVTGSGNYQNLSKASMRKSIDLSLFVLIERFQENWWDLTESEKIILFESWTRLGKFQARQLFRYINFSLNRKEFSEQNDVRSSLLGCLRKALEKTSDFWLVTELRLMEIELSHSDCVSALCREFWRSKGNREDDLFSRSYILERAKTSQKVWNGILGLAPEIKSCTSEYVQIRLCELLGKRDLPSDISRGSFLKLSTISDKAYLALLACYVESKADATSANFKVENLLAFSLQRSYLLRFEIAKLLVDHWNNSLHSYLLLKEPVSDIEAYLSFFGGLLDSTHDPSRRLASWAALFLSTVNNKAFPDKAKSLLDGIASLSQGQSLAWETKNTDEEHNLLTFLTIVCFRGSELHIKTQSPNHYKITKGPVYNFALWRMTYEISHPSPEKRQGVPHWFVRSIQGDIKIPSAIMCEQVATSLIGEPVYDGKADSWTPWLPLISDLVRVVKGKSALRIVTVEAIVTLDSPSSLSQRASLYIKLLRNLNTLNDLRQDNHRGFLKTILKLGFIISVEPQTREGIGLNDPAIKALLEEVNHG